MEEQEEQEEEEVRLCCAGEQHGCDLVTSQLPSEWWRLDWPWHLPPPQHTVRLSLSPSLPLSRALSPPFLYCEILEGLLLSIDFTPLIIYFRAPRLRWSGGHGDTASQR